MSLRLYSNSMINKFAKSIGGRLCSIISRREVVKRLFLKGTEKIQKSRAKGGDSHITIPPSNH